jgi:heat shock protein HslJ
MPARILALVRLLALATTLSLAGCVPPAQSDTRIEGVEWFLVGVEGQAAAWRASLRLDGDKATGQAPCNRWFAGNSVALPGIALTRIGATRMACADLEQEQAYLDALQAMQRVELDQGHLYLIGAEGRIMEFVLDPGEPCLSCLARQ